MSLHFLALPFPFFLPHFRLPSKQLLIRLSITTSQSIPQRSELAIVEVKVEMMHGVASCAIDDWAVSDVLTVVNQDSPDVDEGEEEDVGEFLQREQEREDVIGQGLSPAVQWVEGVRGVRRWHNPFVVRLVKGFVQTRVVETTVDPVDEEVGEEDEEGEL